MVVLLDPATLFTVEIMLDAMSNQYAYNQLSPKDTTRLHHILPGTVLKGFSYSLKFAKSLH